jgi:GDP-L-fucose synthase
MPTNLYGSNDNFDLNNSHVLPALIRKFHEAKINNQKDVTVWGTGIARREFLHVDDMSSGCLFIMKNFNPTKEQNEKGEIFLNLGTGVDISIKELAELVKKVVDFKGEIVWDSTKPDGTMKKLLETAKINNMGWKAKINLENGIAMTYEWFLKNYDSKYKS